MSELLHTAWTKANELLYGIRTMACGGFSHAVNADSNAGNPTADARFADNHRYEALGYSDLRWIRAYLWRQPGARDEVIYDLGCGMGRAICVMATRPFQKVIGVELWGDLAAIARDNCAKMRGRKTEVEVVRADACDVSLDEGTVFVLFNSFGPDTLSAVLERLRESLAANPRRLQFVYYNALYDRVIALSGLFDTEQRITTKNGFDVTIWSIAASDPMPASGNLRQ